MFCCNPSSDRLPESLTAKPTLSLVPPGECQFTPDFVAVPLLKKWTVSETSYVLRFGVPDTAKPLNLSTCACILAKAEIADKDGNVETIVRPYTPISTNTQIGSFDLLIKDYKENGQMSRYLCEDLAEGDSLDFKHIEFNVKTQAPFAYKKIGMLVGGTGITPMIQALHAILGDKNCEIKVDMLYGSRVSTDILGKEMLDSWAKQDRLKVTHVLSHEPEDSSWKGARGFITKELIAEKFPSPEEDDIVIMVCGPAVMYDIFSGPRGEKEVGGILAEMGYSSEQVYKF
mmetsp:Transcript_20820/g.35501  ORF Transcript_20820/g.35501 Transcript_20820/m.35501 type:complete len:287 (-) Transcript_20820:1735-2595(-)